MNTFGSRIKQRREALNMSQAQLSKKLKISQSAIALLENGRNQSTTKIIELAAILQTTPEWLLTGMKDKIMFTEPYVQSDFASSPNSPLGLKLSYLKQMEWEEDHLLFFQQFDTSMSPTIELNDCVVCHTQLLELEEGAIFLIKRNQKLILRRAFLGKENNWIYRCDNYDKIKYADLHQLNDDIIMGKVIWSGGYQRFV